MAHAHCANCHTWQKIDRHLGSCLKDNPDPTGWPSTKASDWCSHWQPPCRVIPKTLRRQMPLTWKVGLDARFAQDHPDAAKAWVEAVTSAPCHTHPGLLRPMLTEIVSGKVTPALPYQGKEGESVESLLRWAVRYPGHSNDALSVHEYKTVLSVFDSQHDIDANRAALNAVFSGNGLQPPHPIETMQTHTIPLDGVKSILSLIVAVMRSREVELVVGERPAILSHPVEEIHQPELWAIRVHDPEDIWAMPSKEMAEVAAACHQKMLDEIADEQGLPPPENRVKAVLWPYDKASHTEALLQGEGTLFDEEIVLM